MNVVLVCPQIPQNTGNIGRLCVCTETTLHLIEPYSFDITEKAVRRSGLDYWPYLDLKVHSSWESFLASEKPEQMVFASTKTEKVYHQHQFKKDDYIIFGNEGSGLPEDFYEVYKDSLITIPMKGNYARSHNLSNSVAIVLYEGLRQIGEI